MASEEKNERSFTIVEYIIGAVQIILIPVLFSFDSRIRDLEKQNARIEQVDKKLDHLIEMQEKQQLEQTQFYKDYAAALEYAKREMQKK